MRRQRELKSGTSGSVWARPQSSLMSFDDRAANRQSQSQLVWFGCVEGLEQPVDGFGSQPWPRIPHLEEHTLRFGLPGADQQMPRTFFYGAHSLDSIDQHIENHLL